MMTNADISERYFRIQFQGLSYEVFEYGATALDAIATARQEVIDAGFDADTLRKFGNATARLAVYGEHRCGAESFTIDGTHTHIH